jgi:DNA-binding transcriptional regulator WhiA
MGYSLNICRKCCQPDTDENLKNIADDSEADEDSDDDSDIYLEHCKECKKSNTYLDISYEEIKNILEDLKIYDKRISIRTLMCPYYEKEKMKEYFFNNYKIKLKDNEFHPLIVWNRFWKSIDYLLITHHKIKFKKTQKYKNTLKFVHDFLR